MRTFLALCLLFVGLALRADPIDDALKNLAPHPRIMLDKARFDNLKKQAKTDPVLQGYVREILKSSDAILRKGKIEYKIPDGKRLLGVSREARRQIMTVAFAYRWTGDQKYLKHAIMQLDAVCAFKDWNPSHFLDTGEMATAVALGYDWLFDALSAEQRKRYTDATAKFALNQKPAWWLKCNHNWNAVCNGGLAIAALATHEAHPTLSAKILRRSVDAMPSAMKNYAPDGLWFEGIGYWEYMSEYAVMGIASMFSAVDTDFGLSDFPGFDKTAEYPIYNTAPSGGAFYFGDCYVPPLNNPKRRIRPMFAWELFWLAERFNQPAWSALERAKVGTASPHLLHLVFYQGEGKPQPLALARHFTGIVEAVFMRTAWNDPNAAWLAVKSGKTNVNHAHLDAGTFEYEVNGIRWFLELGRDNYNMPGYFGNKRWTYYRLNSASHNVMEFNGKRQNPKGSANVRHFDPEAKSVVLDMVKAYAEPALKSYTRTLRITDSVLHLSETFMLDTAIPYRWGVTTNADITLSDDPTAAVLTKNGKRLRAEIVTPKNLSFFVGSCHREPPENANIGFRRLEIKGDGNHGKETKIEMRFIAL